MGVFLSHSQYLLCKLEENQNWLLRITKFHSKYVLYSTAFPGSALVCPACIFSWIKWEDKSLGAFLQRLEEPKTTSGIAENLFIYLISWIYPLSSHCIKHDSRKRWWLQKHERQCITLQNLLFFFLPGVKLQLCERQREGRIRHK